VKDLFKRKNYLDRNLAFQNIKVNLIAAWLDLKEYAIILKNINGRVINRNI
jgi:hypothetical protein